VSAGGDGGEGRVVVVGGGPAGAATAYYLAARGHGVIVIDRQAFPRDKSCGDGLTRRAVRVLDEMGVLPALRGAQRISGVRVVMRGKGTEVYDYARDVGPGFGLVVPRLILDDAILRRAAAAGAEIRADTAATGLIREGGVVRGVRVRAAGAGAEAEVRAAVTVVAGGAATRLAHAGADRRGEPLGFAIRAYLSGLDGLDDKLEIYAPILDVNDRYLLPSYGWLFPIDGSTANFGIGLFERIHNANLRAMAEQFLAERRQADPRFDSARLTGGWKAAPLRFDFSPERCAGPGVVLVGDAAGLVSPFTGEGISYALESARLAAATIDRGLATARDGPPDLTEYAVQMERHYTGYFEAGRHSARRYRLAWHVLENTFERRGPLFSLARRAIFLPEDLGELYASHVLDDVGALIAPGLDVRQRLLAVGEVLLDVVRREWPFLGLTWLGGHGDPGIPFRPALLVLLTASLGDPSAPRISSVAAALELGYLAALAQLSVEEEPRAGPSPDEPELNWGNMAAVILGDFLLTKAYALSAEAGASVSAEIAAALDEACRGEVGALAAAYDLDVGESRHLELLAGTTAPLFALPCRLGAVLGGATRDAVEAVTAYGRELGLAYRITDDALAIDGSLPTIGASTSLDVRRGVYGLAVIRAASTSAVGAELRHVLASREPGEDDVARVFELVRRAGVLPSVLRTARRYAERAKECLSPLPDDAVRASLARLADFAAIRQAGSRPALETVFDSPPRSPPASPNHRTGGRRP
jgi:geranylgeranyl reductase family protein